MAYATKEELATLVQGTLPEATANLLLDLATGEIDRAAGRPLASATYTETVDGGRSTLWLDWPLTAVTEVVEDGETVPPSLYRHTRAGALERLAGTWADQVEVTYTAGFESGAPELSTAKRITLALAARVAANPQSLDSLSADGITASFLIREGMTSLPALALSEVERVDVALLASRRRVA